MLMRLDSACVERFHAEGFLVFNTELLDHEITTLHRILTGLINRDAGFKEGALSDAMGIDDGQTPRRFTQILHPRVFAPALMDSDFHRLACGIVEQFLGPDVRFRADICLMEPARIGKATPWHQDEASQDPAFTYNEISF